MTHTEQISLNQLSEYIREWRDEDKTWKADVGERLKKLEDDKVARDAVKLDRENNRSNNLWKIAALVAFISTTAAGVTVAALRFMLHI